LIIVFEKRLKLAYKPGSVWLKPW